jgi:hypothetical protein
VSRNPLAKRLDRLRRIQKVRTEIERLLNWDRHEREPTVTEVLEPLAELVALIEEELSS